MFAGLRAETDCNPEDELLWSYYFTAATPEALEPVAEVLDEREFDVVEIFDGEEEKNFILAVERIEKHTPESLFALNTEMEALAAKHVGVEYDGMDVNPMDECGCGCGCKEEGDCDCEECDCEKEGEEHACGESHGCGCGSSHFHSEDEPIENPELLAALAAIATDKSEDTQHALSLELQRGLYLVPVFAGKPDAEAADDEAVQVLVCTDETGAEYLPLFTDEDALSAWTQEDVSAMVFTAPEAWEFILSQPECAGGVINPGGASLPLNREMVGLLKKMIDVLEAEDAQE